MVPGGQDHSFGEGPARAKRKAISMTPCGKKWQPRAQTAPRSLVFQPKDGRMTRHDIADLAFERTWRVYRLMNPSVDEQDEKRALLDRFIKKCCDAGASDPELVVVEALKFLKRLEEFGEAD